MEFTTFGAFSAYWVKQTRWSQQAPIKTASRIDVPKRRSAVAAGQTTIAGVAWAQHPASKRRGGRGRRMVRGEASCEDTIDTWRQWYYLWDATPGPHMLQVRATDKSGYTQTAVKHKTEPNGATGYHTIPVTVT